MEWLLNMHVRVHVVELEKNTVLLFAFSLGGSWGDMGDSDKSKMISASEMESFSLDAGRFSRDLLDRFMESGARQGNFEVKDEEEDEKQEIELNLGLSLGGRFGVDKTSKKLMRSSSVAACLPVVRDDDAVAASSPPMVSYPNLVRTSSLPVETEEEWRKRKELQTLRRMEAKRRRSEKQRNLKADKETGSSGGGGGGGIGRCLSMDEDKREVEVNVRGRIEKDHFLAAAKRFGSSVALPSGISMLAAADAGQSIFGSAVDVAMGKGKGSHLSGSGMPGLGQQLSQGSVESHGGSSSSDLESRALQGTAFALPLFPSGESR